MTEKDWCKDLREATARPPAGARERVWRRLDSASRVGTGSRAVRWVLATATVLAVAAGVALVRRPQGTSAQFVDAGVAAVQRQARLERTSPREWTLREGSLAVSVWGEPVTIHAGTRTVKVEAAQAWLQVAGDRVDVVANDGVIWVDSEALAPRPGQQRPPALESLAALEPAEAKAVRRLAEAQDAVANSDWPRAVRALDVVAHTSALRAEAALLQKGELELRQLHDPAGALATFGEGDARFPTGSLSVERALSGIDAAVALERWDDVVGRASRFLEAFPTNERVDDVRATQAATLLRLGRRAEACHVAAELVDPSRFAGQCP